MRLRACDYEEIALKEKIKGIMLREWGIMCRLGMGLGYGSCTLNDGKGIELPMPVEQFSRVSDAIGALPARNNWVIRLVYKGEHSIKTAALKMGDTYANADRLHKEAVNMLYGALEITREIAGLGVDNSIN